MQRGLSAIAELLVTMGTAFPLEMATDFRTISGHSGLNYLVVFVLFIFFLFLCDRLS